MANDQINQYPVTAVTIEDASFFDIDQWTGAAFESQKVPATLMASVFGVNIGNSDLQIDDPIRKLILQGASPDAVRFSIRDSADTIDFFKVAGGGIITFNEAFSFPLVDGAVGEVLTTNGSGSVSWAVAGGASTNIGNSDLTISAVGDRKLQMFGSATTDVFKLRDSADTYDMFSFRGDGAQAIGWQAVNSGSNGHWNVVLGCVAKNNGFDSTVAIGLLAETTSTGGVAIGREAKAGLSSTAVGINANASGGQYNISIGQNASCSLYNNIAIGRYASAVNNDVMIGATSLSTGSAIGIGYGVTVGMRAISIGAYSDAIGQSSLAIGYNAQATGIRSGMINLTPLVSTNAENDSLAVNFGTTDHTWRIGATADQWNNGTGSFGFGTITPDASAIVQMDSTTKGFLPPVMRTAEKNAIVTPATGLIVYDTDIDKLCIYMGTAWVTIGQSDTIQFAATDLTTDFTVATFDVVIPVPCGFYVTEVRANVKTAPTGSDAIFDIKMNGVTMLSTLLSIDATELTSTTATTPAVISVPTLIDDNILTINCTQIGSTIAGNGLTITINGYRL